MPSKRSRTAKTMEVLGRDRATESYHVTIDVDGTKIAARVPERLAETVKIGARPTHQAAYVWMAKHQKSIETAIETLARGNGRPRAPFDQITLVKED